MEFNVKNQFGTLNIPVRALVSDICFPLEDQVIELAQKKYEHLKGLDLADQNPQNLPLKVDILIGSQHYWQFMGKKTNSGRIWSYSNFFKTWIYFEWSCGRC